MLNCRLDLRGIRMILPLALLAFFLTACSSDVTGPDRSMLSNGDEEGEVPLPVDSHGLPMPAGLSIRTEGGAIVLGWQVPQANYYTCIRLDGQPVGTVNSGDGEFRRPVRDMAGVHEYSVCFAYSGRTSQFATISFAIEPLQIDPPEVRPDSQD